MLIQQIRNATIKITIGGVKFLVDPMFAPKEAYPPIPESLIPGKAWPFCALPQTEAEITADIDAVIMTHYHIDHFDEFAVKALDKNIKILAQDEYDRKVLEGFGFTDTEIISAEGTVFNGVVMYKTECLHGVKEKVQPYYDALDIRGDAMGVVFMCPGEKTLYLAGDTIWYDGVKRALDKYNPDAVIVNAACAQLKTSGPIIMGTDDILALHEYAPNVKIIASHMDTVGHATVDRETLRRFVDDNNFADSIEIPADGETVNLPGYAETAENKKTARRFYALLNQKRYDEAAELIHPDFVYWPQVDTCLHGGHAFMDIERANMDPCGDYKMRTKFIIAEDDRVAVYLTFDGVLLGDNWHGVPVTNKHMVLDFMCMLRFKDGKIIEKRAKYDRYFIFKSLGVKTLELK